MGLVSVVVALHYADEVDHDVPAVVRLFSDEAVEIGGCGRHVPFGAILVFGVDSLEGCLDVVSPEIALALFESESRQYPGSGNLVGAGVVVGHETEQARRVFDLHEDTLEVTDDVASVVGLFEDDLPELCIRFSGGSGHVCVFM